MFGIFGDCLLKTFKDEPVATWSTILEFLFSVLIGVCGVTVNDRYRKKLQEETRNTPAGRKGNVLEPIMRWYCILQMIFWPYELLLLWITTNEVIPFEWVPFWIRPILYYVMRFGRMSIAYNSLFVALIRFLYIVHRQRANQCDFERTGRWFQIASIAIPIVLQTLHIFTSDGGEHFAISDRFGDCLASFNSSYTTENVRQFGLELALRVLPSPLVLTLRYIYIIITVIVICNAAEVFLYIKIFQSMQR